MFDARAARALQPGGHLTVEGVPGLRLVATASLRTWQYRYKSPVDGRMRQIRLGHWPAMGLPAALSAWEKVRTQRAAGADPAAEKRQRRRQAAVDARESAYTVRAAASEFLAFYSGTVAPKTYCEADRLLTRDIDAIERRSAASITRADAFDLLNSMRDRPVVAGALRRLLGAVWDHALDAGRLPPDVPNWWRLVLRGKLPSKGKIVGGEHQGVEKRALSEAEIALLIPWLPNFPRDIDDALTLYLWTCCRGAEIMAMAAEEITEEPDGLWWTVPREKLKMRRNPLTIDLRVPLVGRAEAVVRRRLDALGETKKGYLFPSRGRMGYVEQKSIGAAVWCHMKDCTLRPEWARPRLPVANWSPHDLRRTGRTLLAALGCPADPAEAILGHMLPGVRGVYDRHNYDAERRLWLTRLAARLELIAGQARAPS
jgi:integrase